MIPLEMRRRCYAEEIAATADLRSAALVEALASVPRERFLGAGPWTVRGEADVQAQPRRTPDADPSHVYHNYAIAITYVAIYNALSLRDEATAGELGAALARNPLPLLKQLRRDPHEAGAGCWLHRAGWCLSTTAR